MPGKRRSTVGIAALLIVALCGCSGASGRQAKTNSSSVPTSTQSATPPPADVGPNLELADLPDGWADMPYQGGIGAELARCAALGEVTDVTHSQLLLTGGEIAQRRILSEVATVDSPATAARDLVQIRHHPKCLREMATSKPEPGLTQGPITVTSLPPSLIGPRAIGYKIRTSTNYKGQVVDEEYTLLVQTMGATELLMYTHAYNGSFDLTLYKALLSKLRNRVLIS